MEQSAPTILISSGETSGDLHAAKLVTEVYRRWPSARVLALGGDRMKAAGAELLFHIRDYSVMGFSGVLANLPKFIALEKALKKTVAGGIDLFIPVDYPGLNLRVAAHARKAGVPVLYYISPQVWAWGAGRVKRIAETVDFMALILPFEEEIYLQAGVPSEFVGHPFVEDHAMPAPLEAEDRKGLGMLPGSREEEVGRILPIFLKTAKRIGRMMPPETIRVGMAPSVRPELYRRIAQRCRVPIELVKESRQVMHTSKLLLVASGTATLESALMETPLIIVYRTSFINYRLARRLVKVQNIGLVNIVLGEKVCPEYIQGDAQPEVIAGEALALLNDASARRKMVGRFKSLRKILTGSGGCRRIVEIAAELLDSSLNQ